MKSTNFLTRFRSAQKHPCRFFRLFRPKYSFKFMERSFISFVFLSLYRSETRGNNMSHAETSAHCRAFGNLQLRGHAVYGLWIVSTEFSSFSTASWTEFSSRLSILSEVYESYQSSRVYPEKNIFWDGKSLSLQSTSPKKKESVLWNPKKTFIHEKSTTFFVHATQNDKKNAQPIIAVTSN